MAKKRTQMKELKGKKKPETSVSLIIVMSLVALGIVSAAYFYGSQFSGYKKFETCDALAAAFSEESQKGWNDGAYRGGTIAMPLAAETAAADSGESAPQAAPSSGTEESHSTTNVQVEGVDEADIVKTDGKYIYTLSTGGGYYYGYRDGTGQDSMMVIADAYPAETAAVLSETNLGNFYPQEIFIKENYVMIFGSSYEEVQVPMPDVKTGTATATAPGVPEPEIDVVSDSGEDDYEEYAESADDESDEDSEEVTAGAESVIAPDYNPGYYYQRTYFMTVKIFDVSDKSNPVEVRSVDFEGNYVSSRMIGSDVYFVVNSYPTFYAQDMPVPVPLYRDMSKDEIEAGAEVEMEESCGCAEVGYFEPVQAQNFVTIASIKIDNPDAEVIKEVIVGSGQNVYASQENLYMAETVYPYWDWRVFAEDGSAASSEDIPTETTVIHKFGLDSGTISYIGYMEVPGWILNQFSMDEHNGYFRIATTSGNVARTFDQATSSNNIYIFDSDLNQAGSIEDIAPGEQIYSARFMGDRGYLVTFKKIDPFFVIDLSDPYNPQILGKLKIPGYSDYLHPYDENHIIGIGIETVEAEEGEDWGWDFAWFQGVKMAIFDVTDVSNPVQIHKVVIGDRGTRTEVSNTHKALLFDREKNLLVLPITLAEIPENLKQSGTKSNTYGDFVYQGAYVYDISLENGFVLKGRVTHYENDDAFQKSGYYWYDGGYNIKRSLYISDVLYTVSNSMIKANSLADLSEIIRLEFGG